MLLKYFKRTLNHHNITPSQLNFWDIHLSSYEALVTMAIMRQCLHPIKTV